MDTFLKDIWEKTKPLEFHTIASDSEIVSEIFQNEAIIRNLFINSFTGSVDKDKQLHFTRELTLHISMEEFQFLVDKVRTNNQNKSSYVAEIYVALKDKVVKVILKIFFIRWIK
ncbi:hypothetical protein [Candidatus Cardinium hertigii]|uniref:Uncharacterized protein n=1 Tax=Candidatus Cardinium hertigii TaxID=247481 RepID=A0A2Z3L8D4_9BACT|nr:hypothetical protein [Candidatus Cardinium hertigii]AWN81697.1 hypothetical protein DK880_00369 [Candidatus Cardinium hertigii]